MWKTWITLYIIFRVYYILLSYLSCNFFESIFLAPWKKKIENFHEMLAALKACRVPTLKQTKQVRNHYALARASCKTCFLTEGTEYNLQP